MNYFLIAAVLAAFLFFSLFVFLKGKAERFNKAIKRLSMHCSLLYREQKCRRLSLCLDSIDGYMGERRTKVRAVQEGKNLFTTVSVSIRAIIPNPFTALKGKQGITFSCPENEKMQKIFNQEVRQEMLGLKCREFSLQLFPGRVLFKRKGLETSFHEFARILALCRSIAERAESQ